MSFPSLRAPSDDVRPFLDHLKTPLKPHLPKSLEIAAGAHLKHPSRVICDPAKSTAFLWPIRKSKTNQEETLWNRPICTNRAYLNKEVPFLCPSSMPRKGIVVERILLVFLLLECRASMDECLLAPGCFRRRDDSQRAKDKA